MSKSVSETTLPDDLICIGKILAAHGVHGEVKVKPLTDNPERFPSLKEVVVWLENEPRVHNVDRVRPFSRGLWLVKFKELSNQEEAAALRGREICIRSGELAELPEGSYYVFEVVGLEVYNTQGKFIGMVADVLSTGSNDVWVIRKDGEGREILLPALKQVIRSVDLAGRRVLVQPMPGLLEETAMIDGED